MSWWDILASSRPAIAFVAFFLIMLPLREVGLWALHSFARCRVRRLGGADFQKIASTSFEAMNTLSRSCPECFQSAADGGSEGLRSLSEVPIWQRRLSRVVARCRRMTDLAQQSSFIASSLPHQSGL